MSDWESLYRRYRELEDQWASGGDHARWDIHDHDGAYRRQQVRARVFADPDRRLERPDGIDQEIWGELAKLNRELDPLLYDAYQRGARGPSAECPCDDVYHAALSMLAQPDAYQVEPGTVYYRGQNYPWSLTPGALRCSSEQKMSAAIKRVREFAVAFRREFSVSLSDEQVASLAQHYIGGTWYLDFSANPYVALFFATDPPRRDGCGVVHTVNVREWNSWSGGVSNMFGALERITVDASRVRNQDWSSLRTPHPSLMRMTFLRSLYFKQVPGMVFRDATRHPPITHAHIYPPPWDDPYKAFAERWAAAWAQGEGDSGRAPALKREPDLDVLRLSSREVLARVARSRITQLRAEEPERYLYASMADNAAVDKSVDHLASLWATGIESASLPELSLFHFMANLRRLAAGRTLPDAVHSIVHSLSQDAPGLAAILEVRARHF